MFVESLDVNSQFFILAYFEFFFFIFGEQVSNSLVVDFQHTDHDFKALGTVWVSFYLLENLITDNGYNATVGPVTNHGVGLSRTGLAIGKQTAVITLPKFQIYPTMH